MTAPFAHPVTMPMATLGSVMHYRYNVKTA